MKTSNTTLNNENGATIVFVAATLALLIMFTALAIDVGHLYGVRNELHDAADAGALAGARVLFNDDGTLNRDAALAEGARLAEANRSGNVLITETTVETGHWSFTNKTFTASEATEQTTWEERSNAELDLDDAFINAVRVRADRSDTPSFFAKIFGFNQFLVSNDAVAYIGFAGTVYPLDVDQPIAICREYITGTEGNYTCDKGRMINSGNTPTTANSGGWTNFTQESPADGTSCTEPTPNNAQGSGMLDYICSGNKYEIKTGLGMAVKGGQAEPALKDLYDCWKTDPEPNKDCLTGAPCKPWNMTLPVVDCEDKNNAQGCLTVVGTVNVNVIWINDKNDPQYKDVPREMTAPGYEPWTCVDTITGLDCWNDFTNHFDLESVEYLEKTLYFLPDCTLHEPMGNSGGDNFGILAKFPKLVE